MHLTTILFSLVVRSLVSTLINAFLLLVTLVHRTTFTTVQRTSWWWDANQCNISSTAIQYIFFQYLSQALLCILFNIDKNSFQWKKTLFLALSSCCQFWWSDSCPFWNVSPMKPIAVSSSASLPVETFLGGGHIDNATCLFYSLVLLIGGGHIDSATCLFYSDQHN